VYYFATDAFANVSAIVLTPRSVEVTWYPLSDDFTGYLISYTTNASYTSGGNVTVNGGNTTSIILTNLEENTLYTITVQAISNDRLNNNTIEASATTYTDGMYAMSIILMRTNQ